MPQKKPFRLSSLASDDLNNILEYSLLQFGELQAEKYFSVLQDGFETLSLHPKIGKKAYEIYTGLRSLNKGKHCIYYLETDQNIEIIRILSQYQDPTQHL